MLIKRRRGWELPESAATPEPLFHQRRRLLQGLAAGPVLLATGLGTLRGSRAEERERWADLYPVERNERYGFDERLPEMTDESLATTYNNFYEFGSHKQISRAAQALVVHPWTVTIDGLVEEEQTLDIDDLLRRMPLEERVYRLRCVEAWSMVVPWSGFPLQALVDLARPVGSARYLRMETFEDSSMAPGQRQFWYPWPYIEGLTMAEATNELAFIATGLYGKPLPKQNGAPLRLAVPWKYGFKSIKSIVRFTFTEERPVSFWEEIQGNEYGFWANVNPEVPHPRWSQAMEEPLGRSGKVPTVIFNG
jgi:methionine sulfoxide reductase catalytic subunit